MFLGKKFRFRLQNFLISSNSNEKGNLWGKSQHRIKTFMEISWESGEGAENKDIVIPTSPDFMNPISSAASALSKFGSSTLVNSTFNFPHPHLHPSNSFVTSVMNNLRTNLHATKSFYAASALSKFGSSTLVNSPFSLLASSSPSNSFVTPDEQSQKKLHVTKSVYLYNKHVFPARIFFWQ